MTDLPTLLIAARGVTDECGLVRAEYVHGSWRKTQLTTTPELSALVAHPTLPILYGVSGSGRGVLHEWRMSGAGVEMVAERDTGGENPCHVAISPHGTTLVVSNYSSSSVSVWKVGRDGSLAEAPRVSALAGSGVERTRQDQSHPHHAVFDGDLLRVVDLGADVVRTFSVGADGTLTAAGIRAVPAGTGPRHLVLLRDGLVALSAELSSRLLVGSLDGEPGQWQELSSTTRSVVGGTRNYPSDVGASPDGRFVYLANRGSDTVSVFVVANGRARREREVYAAVAWPLHLAVFESWLCVAGRDSSEVSVFRLENGLPTSLVDRFECPGAAWLIVEPARWS